MIIRNDSSEIRREITPKIGHYQTGNQGEGLRPVFLNHLKWNPTYLELKWIFFYNENIHWSLMNKVIPIIAHIIVSLADFAVLNPGDHPKSYKSGLKWLKWMNMVHFLGKWISKIYNFSLKGWEYTTIEVWMTHQFPILVVLCETIYNKNHQKWMTLQ